MIFIFFSVIALGLASPFLLVAYVPALFKVMPKPGAWMETFKQFMGFTLVATAVWLTDVLFAQIGGDRTIGFLAFLLFVSVGCWIFGRWGGLATSGKKQLRALTIALLVIWGGGYQFLDLQFAEASVQCETDNVEDLLADLDFSKKIPWIPFSDANVNSLKGHTIFVDFTADWCLTCKVNEKTILEKERIRNAMSELNIVPLKADWTRKDDEIGAWLKRFGRAGVPFYLVLPADPAKEPIALPDVITQDLVVKALKEATQ